MAKAKQKFVPGMEPPVVTEIEKGEELLALMRKNKLQTYNYDGRIVVLEELQKVWVRKATAERNDDEDGE